MTKQECIDELRSLLADLEPPVLVKTVKSHLGRIRALCDALDAFERGDL